MHNKYASKGLAILAFPCNQFGGQEPGSDAEVKKFAEGKGVKFDMFSKVDVNGSNSHPLWAWMRSVKGGGTGLGDSIKWNFTKFLINKQGIPVMRYGPQTSPNSFVKDIEILLAEK